MKNLISRAISHISFLFEGLQIKLFFTVVLVGFLLVATNVNPGRTNQAASKRLDQLVHQDDSQRPKTTGEWYEKARETEDSPVERLQEIGKESAEAVKDWGSLYPDTASGSAPDLGDNMRRVGK